jgi:hypothetical protein
VLHDAPVLLHPVEDHRAGRLAARRRCCRGGGVDSGSSSVLGKPIPVPSASVTVLSTSSSCSRWACRAGGVAGSPYLALRYSALRLVACST